ncbi:MAG: hypothetical protein JO122_04205 [Acetobacteraceae bacterium]|nr:hypothetical protein [Acetobacteraceae bacterium]
MALGAILTLGAVRGAEAQDESASIAGWLASLGGALPALPQNWSDLAVLLRASETAEYDDNVLHTPSNSSFRPVRSWVSISDYGASTKLNWQGQQFFADADYGFNRYLEDAALDLYHYSFDGGVNWVLTSRCSGKLVENASKTPSQPTQQVSVNVLNTTTSYGFNETANCGVSRDWGFIFNSGTTTSTNSAAVDKLNNFRNQFVAAGLTYTVAETNILQLLATVTGTNYTDRGPLVNLTGLLSKFTEDQINLSYTRVINTNLSLIGSIGVVGLTNGDFNLGWPSGWQPQYSFSATWSLTPKTRLTASVARIVTPPTSVIGNLQRSETAVLDLRYELTPKVSLGVGGAWSLTSGFGGSLPSGQVSPSQLGPSSRNYSFHATVGYAMTPFLTGNLSYQYFRQIQAGGLVTPTNLALLTVVYAPY